MEELVDAAYELTYEAEDGTQVHGFVITGDNYANIVDIARAWDGDFITQDYELAVTGPGMTRGAQTLRDFYEKGVLPTNWAAIKNEDVNTWLQTGRAAMTTTSCGRNRIYNDPEKSKEAGNIKTIALPVGEDFKDQFAVAPAKVEFWSMVIPRNSQHKELAWSLVQAMLSKRSTLEAALNGNGPVRASTYDAPEIQAEPALCRGGARGAQGRPRAAAAVRRRRQGRRHLRRGDAGGRARHGAGRGGARQHRAPRPAAAAAVSETAFERRCGGCRGARWHCCRRRSSRRRGWLSGSASSSRPSART